MSKAARVVLNSAVHSLGLEAGEWEHWATTMGDDGCSRFYFDTDTDSLIVTLDSATVRYTLNGQPIS